MGTGNIQTLAGKCLPQMSAAPAHRQGRWLSLSSTHIVSAVLGALQLAQASAVKTRGYASQAIMERGRLLQCMILCCLPWMKVRLSREVRQTGGVGWKAGCKEKVATELSVSHTGVSEWKRNLPALNIVSLLCTDVFLRQNRFLKSGNWGKLVFMLTWSEMSLLNTG